MATFNFNINLPPPLKKEERLTSFLKVPVAKTRYEAYNGEIKEINPVPGKPGLVDLTLHFGAKFTNEPDKGFKVGQTVRVQPLGDDQYEITPV